MLSNSLLKFLCIGYKGKNPASEALHLDLLFNWFLLFDSYSAAYKRAFSRTVTIDFIGVWDTVSSVGAVIPRVLPFSSDNHITKTFRHAVALDEHRAKFRSNTWHLTVDPDEEDETNGPTASVIGTLWRKFRRLEEDLTRSDSDKEFLEAERWELDREGGILDRPPTDVLEVW